MKMYAAFIGLCLVPFAALAQAPTPAEATPARTEIAAPPATSAGSEGTTAFSQEQSNLDELLRNTADVIKAIEEANAKQAVPASAEGTAPATMLLNARQAVQMAVERNPQALVAQDDVDAAKARIGIAKSQRMPQVKASIAGTATEYNTHGSGGLSSLLTGGLSSIGSLGGTGGIGSSPALRALGFLAQSEFSKKAAEQAQPKDQLVTHQLNVSQVLFAGGQIQAAVRASEYLAKSQEWQRAAEYDKLEYDVKQAYYDSMLAGALVRVAQDSVRTFERNLSDAEHMYEVGLISNFQVLRARTELGARKADTVAAQNGERLALANLRRILALPQETEVALEPKFEWQPVVPNSDELMTYAREHRPELLALKHGIEAAQQDIKRVKGEYLPQVAATADYKNTDGGRRAIPDGWTMSVGAQWDVATGGKRKHERAQADAQLSKLEHQLADIEYLINLDVTQSVILIQDAMAKVQSERENVDLAREGLRLAELRFQEGVGTQSESLEAELALTNAKTKLVQALRDYAVGHASLERATGRSWIRGENDTTLTPTATQGK